MRENSVSAVKGSGTNCAAAVYEQYKSNSKICTIGTIRMVANNAPKPKVRYKGGGEMNERRRISSLADLRICSYK